MTTTQLKLQAASVLIPALFAIGVVVSWVWP